MFQRLIDDFKASTGTAVRQTSLVAIAGLALFITTAFLCAAAFVVVLDRYGLVQACLAGAGLFFIVAMIAALSYIVRKRQIEARAAQRAKSAAHSMLADPVLVATGLQIVRAIGVKRLIPILAVGGLALGILATRGQADDQAPAE
ncbi:MAG TPA: hypothetical protein VNS33_08440 [Bradyrhizobium sp.]|jgi:membrane associated rhomboid family serine protease|nr:hypothetical protein [Bradyrhizobium sp.]